MKKEFYRHALPHFQQPGQAYFITWSIKDAVPKKALIQYSEDLKLLSLQIKSYDALGAKGATNFDSLNNKNQFSENIPPELEKLKKQYYSIRKRYIKAYDELLDIEKNPKINLSKPKNAIAVKESLLFWNNKKLENYAFCIMPNHVHWVFRLFEKDEKEKAVYLQDIMYSVKRFSANQINKLENRKGSVWQIENFDTTIRDNKHLYYAIEYTLNNPVAAGLVKKREDWPGIWFSR